MAASISRNFGNNLTMILNLCDVLPRDKSAARFASDLQGIRDAADGAVALEPQLLAFGRRDTGRRELVNLNTVPSDMGQLIGTVPRDRYAIRSRVDPELRPVEASPAGKYSGLPAALDAIRELGAQIRGFSELGVGSTVRVFFRPAAAVESSGAGAPAQTSGSETILMIDGDDEVRATAARGLNVNGYRVLEPRRAEEARRIAAGEKEIHPVITEVDPNEKNAPEASRAPAEASEARLAYVSSETDAILANHGVLDRPEFLLPKPYSAEQMALFARKVLEHDQD